MDNNALNANNGDLPYKHNEGMVLALLSPIPKNNLEFSLP